MKWYKRDPDAALTGFRGLSHDEKSAYGTIIDLSYSRNGDLPDDEHLLCVHIECRSQWWRRVRAGLIAKHKIRIVDGKIIANRVETTLKEAVNYSKTQAENAKKGWFTRKNRHKNNGRPMSSGNDHTTTPTEEEAKQSNSFASSSVGPTTTTNARSPNFQWPTDEELNQWLKNQK